MATENKVLNTRIKLKRDTSANWESNNPTLLNGEIIIVDTAAGEVRFKIGDGSKTYTQLPFEDEGVRNLIADKSKITVETWNDSSSSTAQFLNELVINKVKDRQTYEEMVDAGKIDTNKLYFIEENDEIIITAHATTGTKIATIAVGDEVTDIYAPPGGVTSITAKDGISSNATTGAITLTNSGVRSITQDTSDAHKLIINTNGTNKTITLPNDKTSYTGEAGIEISGTAIKHSNAITAGSISGSTGDLVYGGTFEIPSISYDAQGHIKSTDVTQVKLPKMPTASDLGLTAAMRFVGVVNSLPTSNNSEGDVVLYGKKEYVWDGTTWVELGDEGSHALKTITISAGAGLTGGGTLEANRTIYHADTSNQASISANGRKYITGVALDDYGHVTGLTTGTETVTDTNTTYTFDKGDSNGQIKVTPKPGDAYNVSVKGLGSAAYTNSDAYAPAAHNQAASTITGLATVATSGNYNDLSNKPTIPTVNNATLTIQKNGTNVATFTANSASNATANITVPTKVSELTNDSGYKTTDTNVTQSVTSSSSWRSLLMHNTATSYGTSPGDVTGKVYYQKDVAVQPSTGTIKATYVYGAVWNDYAEYRQSDVTEAGRVICENGDDTLSLATERLQPGANIVSDTFGFAIGETDECKTPVAVSGRVLVYPYEDRESYKPGDAVCAAPNGTVSKMTREEIREYPERIIGTVSAIPSYETWGTGNVKVNGRIWVKVK